MTHKEFKTQIALGTLEANELVRCPYCKRNEPYQFVGGIHHIYQKKYGHVECMRCHYFYHIVPNPD